MLSQTQGRRITGGTGQAETLPRLTQDVPVGMELVSLHPSCLTIPGGRLDKGQAGFNAGTRGSKPVVDWTVGCHSAVGSYQRNPGVAAGNTDCNN